MLRIFVVLVIILTLRSQDQISFDIDQFSAEPNNVHRKFLFDAFLDLKLKHQKCLTNTEMISGYLAVLESINLSFSPITPTLHLKLFFDQLLKDKVFEKKWEDWDAQTKQYKICFSQNNNDIRAPSKTIDHSNHIVSVRGTFDQYPYLYYQVKSSSISYLMNLIPNELKQELNMARFILYNKKIYQQIYSKNKQWDQYVWKLSQAGEKLLDMDIVMYLGETISEQQIHSYCQKQNWDLQTYDIKFELYRKVIIELPAFMWAKDLKNPLEFNKLLTVDNEIYNDGKWENTYLSTIQATRQISWESKIQKAYFRGSLIGQSKNIHGKNLNVNVARFQLFNRSIHRPDLIDAKPYSKNKTTSHLFEQPSIETVFDQVPIKKQIQSKYLISMDGVTAPYGRLAWSLLSKSLVLKQQTSKIQWFFDHLKPYVHYVPVNQDLTDLQEIIEFARKNDELMQQIAQQGNSHAIDRFSGKRIFSDFVRIFKDYADVQKIYESPPDIDNLMLHGLKYVTDQSKKVNKVQYLVQNKTFFKQVRQNIWSILQTVVFFLCLGLIVLFKYSKVCSQQQTQDSLMKVKSIQTTSLLV